MVEQTRFVADVVVLGGGPAGMCAAIAAARAGAKTILVEQGGSCGGMATQGLVGPFMTCYDRKGERMIIRGLFAESVDRMVAKGGALHPSQVRAGTPYTSWITVGHDHVTPYEPECLKLVVDELLTEAGVQVLYHTQFLRPILSGNTLTAVEVASKAGVERIEGRIFIDGTGDGDVAARCGVPYEMGNEELHQIQPATMFFQICNVDAAKLDADIAANRDNFYRKDGVNYRSFHWYVSKAREAGDWTLNRVSLGLFRMPKDDEWCVNTTRILNVDGTDNVSLTYAEIEGRRQADEVFRFLKKYVPGCENAKLRATASYVGIRETRHMRGEYRLTAEDLVACKVPEDSIALASNSVDIHGRFGPSSTQYIPIEGDYYGIPYRCMLPVGVENLLLAGRCVCADSPAAAAIRVMPPAMAIGQAAGTAAAMAVKNGGTPRTVDTSALRAELVKNGACL